MSVHGEAFNPESPLTIIDIKARESAREAKDALVPIVSRETPRRSGRTAASLQPRVSRTATGSAVVIAPTRGRVHSGRATVADVVRWINRGTGLYRTTPGPKRPITASKPWKRMVLPGGARRFRIAGQHPNPFMSRIQMVGDLRVREIYTRGAAEAARAVERAV